jgi:hypothetical protein
MAVVTSVRSRWWLCKTSGRLLLSGYHLLQNDIGLPLQATTFIVSRSAARGTAAGEHRTVLPLP